MNVPIPTPTPEQIAASVALENSRRQYRLQDRATLLVMHTPDVVLAARDGEPTLADPAPTLAPQITKKTIDDFNESINPGSTKAQAPAPASTDAAAPASDGTTAAAPATAPAPAPLQFQDVPAAGAAPATGAAAVTSIQNNTTSSPAASGNSIGGVTIITPGVTASPADNSGGLKAVGPENATPLPAAEKPEAAPETVNDLASKSQPAAQTPNANGKNAKPAFDKSDESSSKHKKKKGLGKLNPF